MTDEAAYAWFVAGTLPLIVFGALHAIATLVDVVRPTYFTPVDDSVRPAVQGTSIRLIPALPRGGVTRPSMWRVWLGVNVSHGLGIATFGLLCLLIAVHDYDLVGAIDGVRALTIAFPLAFLALSLRFWFWGPVLITASSSLCFAVAAVLSS